MSTALPSLKRINWMYSLVQIAYWAMFAAFAGYQTALLLERGFSSGEAGVFASIRCLAGILSQPILGGWADRHPEVPLKRLLNGCLAVSLAVSLVFYCTRPGFWGTALIFLALGTLELNAYPLVDSMAVQFINAGLDVNYSLGRGLGSFSYAVACVLLGQQSTAFGVESVLLAHAGFLILLMTAVGLFPTFPREVLPPLAGEDRPHSVWYLLKSSRSFTLMLLAAFFALASVLPVVSFFINIVVDRGGNEQYLGLGLFLMAASELPGTMLFPHLKRRLGNRGVLVMSVCFMAAKPLLVLLLPGLFWALAVQLIQMLGYGLFTPSSVYYANESVSVADRVRGQSVMMMASNGLGGMVGNLLAGYAIDLGGVNAMLALCSICGALGVLCAGASLYYSKKNPKMS
jgi:PPP family 3-phenylpropionic acid transporter